MKKSRKGTLKKVTLKKVTYPAIVLDRSKKFTEGELSFKISDEDAVSGFGRFISKGVANIIVEDYRAHLKKCKDEKQPYGVTFGKDILLSILSQTDCEGIRFYFGKREKDRWEKGSKYAKIEGNTLVAVGVDKKNKDLGANGSSIIEKLDKGRIKSVGAAAAAVKGGDDPKIAEAVPPFP